MTNKTAAVHSESYWLKTGHRAQYPKLTESIKTDVAVVGAGIAGILTAYQLLKAGKKVVLLEAFSILNGTTGNTTAKLSAQHGLIYADLIERYGAASAKLYYQANMGGIKELKRIGKELKLGDWIKDETVYAYTTDAKKVSSFEKERDAYEALGIKGKYLQKTPLGIELKAALSMEDQGIFHPVEFLNGVLEWASKNGLKVYENTQITGMDEQANGILVLKDADGHRIKCEQVVFTTHYPIIERDDHYTEMHSRTTQTLAFKTDKKLFEGAHIAYDTPSVTLRTMEYFGDHFFLIGGQSHTTGDGYSDGERYEQIRKLAKKLFGVQEPAFKWSTHDLMTPDHIPFIGQLHPKTPNAYTITGLNAWGLANSSAAAMLITDLIAKRNNPYEALYNPYREIKKLAKDKEEEEFSSTIAKVNKVKVAALAPDSMTQIKHDNEPVGVYKDKNGKTHYFSLKCTHAGCDLEINDGDKTWDCPCHGSRFDKFGKVIYGPALKALKTMNLS